MRPSGERFDVLRQLEVAVREAALGVRGKRHVDRVPRDRQVGVVVHLLGGRRDAVHEVDRPLEVVELEAPLDRVSVALPSVQLRQPALDFVVAQKCHRSPMRIASLVPSATEMLYALGLGDSVVAVTHECDYPAPAARKPHLTRSVIPPGLTAAEIDREVRERTERGEAIYELDADLLRALEPDQIVAQQVCEVCAVSFEDVSKVARTIGSDPSVLSLDPSTIGEVLADVRTLAAAADASEAGEGRLARRADPPPRRGGGGGGAG